jgi:alkanesulfonate monooxygenase SsuD/methylene tetrahydromethanopterin reductase-like flavin-dependent oxidoreductase (luciferase family)
VSGRVRLGVTLPVFTDDPARVLGAARRAEELGLDSVWVFDHLWPLSGGKGRPILEAWSTLAHVAAATTTIGVGTLVTRSSLRPPLLLARMAATVGLVAPGRLTVALGSGDDQSRAENESFGLPYRQGAARVAQLRAAVEVVLAHLTGADGLPGPHPDPRPRVWVAGRSEEARTIAAELADGWNAWGAQPGGFAAELAWLRARAARPLTPTWAGLVAVGRPVPRGEAGWIAGGPDEVGAALRALAAAGAEHLVATLPDASDPEALELLAGPIRAHLD